MSAGAGPSHTQSIYMGTNINDNEAFSFSDIDSDGGGDRHDVLGASQLDGAPLFATQEATHTPLVQATSGASGEVSRPSYLLHEITCVRNRGRGSGVVGVASRIF
ncbi:hypothetical protein U9M48_020007 [Paspalum notatum var. saurae]|uniref:Uncharacterized protein n=1 Tax=Paspalum notatum var. saurae TaxID=547442 RepID=A0AAQ3TGZ8_PASNO